MEPIQVMRCGHTIHQSCFEQLRGQQIYKCPLCSKSALDMASVWSHLSAEVDATPMPDEYTGVMVQVRLSVRTCTCARVYVCVCVCECVWAWVGWCVRVCGLPLAQPARRTRKR